MQVTSTLWPDIKSQKLSEHRFRLIWTKSDARTQFRQAKTGHDQRGPDKEAQDSLLDKAKSCWMSTIPTVCRVSRQVVTALSEPE